MPVSGSTALDGMPLDIWTWISPSVNRSFASLHARAFSHATEDLDKVKTALLNAVGDVDFTLTKVEGHHGNPIQIIESIVENDVEIVAFFRRLNQADIDEIKRTLDARVDEGCNLFVKIDKQAAFKGVIKMGSGDDVISVRVKVRAFPAKAALARRILDEFLMNLTSANA